MPRVVKRPPSGSRRSALHGEVGERARRDEPVRSLPLQARRREEPPDFDERDRSRVDVDVEPLRSRQANRRRAVDTGTARRDRGGRRLPVTASCVVVDPLTVAEPVTTPPTGSVGIHVRAMSTCTGSICTRRIRARRPFRPGSQPRLSAITRLRPAR